MKPRRAYYKARRYVRHHGPRLHLHPRYCMVHGNRVWVTTRATRSKRGAVFCSAECKWIKSHPTREQAAARAEQMKPKCRRPDKLAFDTEAECAEWFHTLLVSDAKFNVYQCRAGHWHGGHPHPMEVSERPLGSLLDPDVADRLRALLDEEAS